MRQRKWSILGVTVIVLSLVLFLSAQQTPIYASEASVLVTPLAGGAGGQSIAPNLATEQELASSVAVAQEAVENLDRSVSPRIVLADLSVTSPADTEILDFSYRHPDPELAQRGAQAFAQGYLDYRRRVFNQQQLEAVQALAEEVQVLQDRLAELQEELALLDEASSRAGVLQSEANLLQGLILQRQLDRLALSENVSVGRIVQPASLATSPVSPNYAINTAFGLLAGLALGLGLAFLRDRLSGRLRSVDEVERHLDGPVLGRIPRVVSWRKRKQAFLVTREEWRSPAAEAYRILRTNLLSAAAKSEAKTILITSARVGEGKSATAANLSLALARTGQRTIVVSVDLKRPRLHHFLDASGGAGLGEVLGDHQNLKGALVRQNPTSSAPGIENLSVLSSGRVLDDSAAALSSERMARLIEELERQADVVILDGPPVLPVTDALVLARIVDGVLLVIGPRNATSHSVTTTRQQLERVGARILGAVMNGLDPRVTQRYDAYYSY